MTRSNSSELLCVLGECFTKTTLPANIVEMAMRVSCQIGKFHGIIARIGPRGRQETYALTVPVGAGSSAIIFGPCSAYQSASCALFSISASASEKIFPISVVCFGLFRIACSRSSLHKIFWPRKGVQQLGELRDFSGDTTRAGRR